MQNASVELDSDPSVTVWEPAKLLAKESIGQPEFALVVLNQPIYNLQLLQILWEKATFRIAADGGGDRLLKAFRLPNPIDIFNLAPLEVICGDLDSLTRSTREFFAAQGTTIIEIPEQYSTDFTKCVTYLRTFGTGGDIIVMGGVGGRVDQGISTLHHLYMFQENYAAGRMYLASSEGLTFVLTPGQHRIRVRDNDIPLLGKHIGIIPLGHASTITTRGLTWDVADWFSEVGGQISTSNVVQDDWVDIKTTHRILFTIDLAGELI